MNVSEITDERLNELAETQWLPPDVNALARSEQEHRRATKVEKVEYFADFSTFIKVVNGVMVEFKGVKVCAKVGDWFGYNSAYHPITQQEYQAAKVKKMEPVVRYLKRNCVAAYLFDFIKLEDGFAVEFIKGEHMEFEQEPTIMFTNFAQYDDCRKQEYDDAKKIAK